MNRLVLALALVLAACATPPAPGRTETDTSTLLALNRRIAETQIVDRDATFFLQHTAEGFRVLAPGGVIEDREKAARGVAAWDAASVVISREDVVFHGDTAILTGRLDIDGTMAPIGRWGPLKFMAVFQRTDAGWIQLSRALTPCLPKAVELDLC